MSCSEVSLIGKPQSFSLFSSQSPFQLTELNERITLSTKSTLPSPSHTNVRRDVEVPLADQVQILTSENRDLHTQIEQLTSRLHTTNCALVKKEEEKSHWEKKYSELQEQYTLLQKGIKSDSVTTTSPVAQNRPLVLGKNLKYAKT
jgi:MarR-like DNA-binding transcriptional regulator SgrR of sgrS sRNA